jgi:DNA-binding SARP family transcriptional activator
MHHADNDAITTALHLPDPSEYALHMREERGLPSAVPGVVIGVLGDTTLTSPHGASVPLTVSERKLLTLLTAVEEDGATLAQLEEVVWSGTPPASARQSLHNHLHRLRTKLGGARLRHEGDRYRLHPRPRTDVTTFEALIASAEDALRSSDAVAALELVRQALALWRGEPYADLPTIPGVVWARARLSGLRAAADDLLVRSLLATGHTAAGIAELEHLLSADAGNEARWELLIEALHGTGRRGEALDAFHRARAGLVGALGIEPGERLQELQRLVLDGQSGAVGVARDLDPVGRDGLLAALLGALRDRRLIGVRGEGGIGKSAVLRGVARRWPGPVITVRCGGNPFSALEPVANLIAALAPRLRAAGLPSSLEEIAARVTGGPSGPGQSPGTLVHRAVSVIVEGFDTQADTLLVLDDVDQAGPTTRDVLARVTAAIPGPVLAAVRAVNPILPGWPEDATHEVEGLDLDGSIVLAGEILEADAPALGTWLHHFTGGHPLFMLATLADLLGRGVLEVGRADPPPPTSAPVPAHVREVLQHRIASLGANARRAVDVVAVLGEPLNPGAHTHLADPADLALAVRAGILVDHGDDTVWFAHDLLHRVAYDYVPAGRRAELHHAAAELGRSSAHRASHLLATGDLDPVAAVAAAARAGADAAAAQAYAEAADWYERSLAIADGILDPVSHLELRVEHADARRLAGLPGHAETLLDAAEESLGVDGDTLRRRAVLATLQLGGAVEPGPTQQRAAALAARVLDEEEDAGWWARIAAAASLVHSMAGGPAACRELFRSAWAAAPDEDAVLVDVLPYAYMGLGHPDDLDDRARAAVRLTEAADRTGNPVAAFEAGHLTFSVALQRADGPAARRAHAGMEELTDRVADAGRRWSLAYQEAALAAIDGRFEDAERAAERALDIGSGVAPRRAFGAYAGQLFELRRLQGRLAELGDLILQLVDDQPEVPGWAAAGALALVQHDPGRSRALFDVAAEGGLSRIPRDFAWLASVMSLGRAAALLDDPRRAGVVRPVLEPYRDLVCWEGTCTWGPVAEVLSALASVQGDADTAEDLAGLAAARQASLSAR